MAYVLGKLGGFLGADDQGQTLTKRSSGTPSASAGDSSKPPSQFSKSQFQNAGVILDRNKGADQGATANRIAQPAVQKLDQDYSQIQKDKGDYQKSQTQKIQEAYKPVGQETVEKGVRGDEGSYGALQRAVKPETVQADTFSTINLRPNSELQSLSQGSASQALQQRARGPYSAGMGALDAASFQRSGGASRVASQLGDLQTRNQNALSSTQGLQDQFQQQALAARDALAGDTRSLLTGLQGDLRRQSVEALPGELERLRAEEERQAIDEARAAAISRANMLGGNVDDVGRRFDEYAGPRRLGLDQEAISRLFPDGYVDEGRAQALSRLGLLLGEEGSPLATQLNQAPIFQDAAYRDSLMDYAQNMYLPGLEDAAPKVSPITPTLPYEQLGDKTTPIIMDPNTTGKQKTKSLMGQIGEATGLSKLGKLLGI